MRCDPGELRTVLVYQEIGDPDAVDANGGSVEEWVDRFELRARLRPLSARETAAARAVESTTTHEAVCRWRPGVATTGRLVVRGTTRVLGIDSVVTDEGKNTELVIGCVERGEKEG